jgi:phage major head subunit gpT-like protein
MIVNTVALERGIKTEFNKAYAALLTEVGVDDIMAVATVVPSTGSDEKYGFLGDIPAFQEWVGDKVYGDLIDYDYTITNKDFYSGIAIDRNEIEDDRMGIIMPRIQMLAAMAAAYEVEMVEDLLSAGTSDTAYDSSAFFANRTAPNDNLLSGTGVSTLAVVKADIYSTRSTMAQFTSDKSRLLRVRMDSIACPPEAEGVFMEAVTTAQGLHTTAGVMNPIRAWIKRVIMVPQLTDANDWYGFDASKPLRPFIYQRRKAITTQLDDTEVKKNRHYYFSAELRGRAGYGLPQLAAKVVN